ncbi:hydroxymethylbilane synthase, partial [Bacillus inaquosorum]|nr:hydroxymethylbilane synthase [Bacillus inaquosorum]
AIECRESDEELLALFSQFTDEYTERTVLAERAYLNAMEGGCQVPIAGYSVLNGQDEIELTGLVASPDGKIIFKETVTGNDPEEVGKRCA